MRRTVWVRSSRKRAGRGLLTNGRVRITTPGRRLTDQERAEVVKQMQDAGRLGREVR
jgi:hypothetical protein